MNADFYFDIGKTHTICQDYARSAVNGDKVAIFLSDGCSSSPNTDFGARFLCTAAAQQWESDGRLQDSYPFILRAYAMSQMAVLPETCLDATLLAAFQEENGVRVRVWGDGVVAARERVTGRVRLYVIQSPKGAPDYPSYLLDRGRQGNYFRFVEGATKDIIGPEETKAGTLFEGVSLFFSADVFDLVAIMSDGAQSFQRRDERGNQHPVSVEEVVAHVMNLRGDKGEFIVRTVRNVFINRHCAHENWTHYDDFTVAALFIPAPVPTV